MKIKPLSDRVLLKPSQEEAKTKSGIYIPETASKERPYVYEVIAIWPGKEEDWKRQEMYVKVWDKVLSWQYSWDDIKIDWEEYKIVGQDYILWVVEQ